MSGRAQLAMYKGPASDWQHKIGHWAVCFFTGSIYSHCELVIDGVSYSSSSRDGGVRSKVIDFTSGRWDVFELALTNDQIEMALRWFEQHKGQGYDWAGVLRFLLPFLPQRDDQWFCSEALAAMLRQAQPERFAPIDVLELYGGDAR